MIELPKRKPNRLPGYDYSLSGYYFVTVCVKNRYELFGEVVGGEMRLNEYGVVVDDEIIQTNTKRPNVNIKKYIVMPNHIHLIVQIVGAYCIRPNEFEPIPTGVCSVSCRDATPLQEKNNEPNKSIPKPTQTNP